MGRMAHIPQRVPSRLILCLLVLWLARPTANAAGQAPPAQAPVPAPDPPPVTWVVTNTTRVEVWRYFEPPPGGGRPDYEFVANRLLFGLELKRPVYEIQAAGQYVQFGGLPTDASGPGPLGTGAVYYGHSGRTDSHGVYVRYLNLALKAQKPGLTVRLGRMGYSSGMESASGRAKVERVKGLRVGARLVGEFGWSLYQRAFDGVRADLDRPAWHVSLAAMRPTQGGFEERAGVEMTGVRVLGATATARPGRPVPGTEVQAFAWRYDDTRPVGARPDNTGRPASAVDVHVNTFGATLVGSWAAAGGEIDALLSLAAQNGEWYGEPHRGALVAAEAGYQWAAPGRPWVRGGYTRASGDRDPADGRHGTFFPMLPTGRKFSLSATYAQMNLTDLFAQVLLRPRPAVGVRIDVHRIGLAEAADLWYFGSGATQQSGTIFGFAGRRSNGSTSLGTVVETSVDWQIAPRWSVNAYVGHIRGGRVVTGTFAGDALTFACLEQVIRF